MSLLNIVICGHFQILRDHGISILHRLGYCLCVAASETIPRDLQTATVYSPQAIT